jgi:hypothetical protein
MFTASDPGKTVVAGTRSKRLESLLFGAVQLVILGGTVWWRRRSCDGVARGCLGQDARQALVAEREPATSGMQ